MDSSQKEEMLGSSNQEKTLTEETESQLSKLWKKSLQLFRKIQRVKKDKKEHTSFKSTSFHSFTKRENLISELTY